MAKTTESNEKQNRIHTVKVRMTDDEYDNFNRRCKAFKMTQSAMIRSALSGAVVRPVIRVSPVNNEVLTLLNDLIMEGKRIGNNINQIAHNMHFFGCNDPYLQENLKKALGELSEWKYEILKKAGTAIGNTETHKL